MAQVVRRVAPAWLAERVADRVDGARTFSSAMSCAVGLQCWPRYGCSTVVEPTNLSNDTVGADSPLEGEGFEPSVPLVQPAPEKGARALCARSAEMRAHA